MRQHILHYLAHYNLLQMKVFYVGQALFHWRQGKKKKGHKEIKAVLGLIPVIQSTPKFQLYVSLVLSIKVLIMINFCKAKSNGLDSMYLMIQN